MSNRIRILTIGAVAALGLVGCTQQPNTDPGAMEDPNSLAEVTEVEQADGQAPTAPPTSSATTESDEVDYATETSARGLIPKEVGEEFGFGRPVALLATVDDIRVDAPCEVELPEKPENGHLIAVDMTVQTTKDYDPARSFMDFSASGWSVVGPDGLTESALDSIASYSCVEESKRLPYEMTSASTYKGTVMLDSKNTSGVLTLTLPMSNAQGWEWELV